MLRILVSNDQQKKQIKHAHGPLEFGRASEGDSARVVIVDPYVSRDQLRIQLHGDNQLRVENLGGPVILPDETMLAKGQSSTLALPARLMVGYTVIDVELDDSPALDGTSLLQTLAPPMRAAVTNDGSSLARLGKSPDSATLAGWFETLLSVQRSAAGSAEFYSETARAVVDLVGLDRGLVLLREQDDWKVVASHARSAERASEFSRSILTQVMAQQRTLYRGPDASTPTASLMMIDSVVASPIFDSNNNVVGAVYGSRDLCSETEKEGIQPIEAQVVQLLAGTVSAGLARMKREQESARLRFQFEQFVSPVLARELEQNPSLLEGRERKITVLFSDLRGFSRIAERIGPRDTYRLVGDVMDRLTDCVMENGGVIVDFYGDGMEAMWNAPTDQADHAAMACRAALDIQGELPALNARWESKLGAPLRIGIGINSGFALVGNAGSTRRLKYGPRGHTVNLASRVEGATKYLDVPILVSQYTRELIDAPFAWRKVCRVRVMGIDQPVELYELHGASSDREWLECRDQYEQALTLYEQNQCFAAQEISEGLLKHPSFEKDRPTQVLAESSAAYALQPAADFDPIFELDSK